VKSRLHGSQSLSGGKSAGIGIDYNNYDGAIAKDDEDD
jgi:hypothetical protein